MDFSFVAQSMKMGGSPTDKFKEKWFADSGASMHMCNKKSIVNDLDENYCQDVSMGNGGSTDVLGKGTVIAHATVRAKKKVVAFKETFYVPDSMRNL